MHRKDIKIGMKCKVTRSPYDGHLVTVVDFLTKTHDIVIISGDCCNFHRPPAIVSELDFHLEPVDPKDNKTPLSKIFRVCNICDSENEFADANQPDGSYVCYNCR